MLPLISGRGQRVRARRATGRLGSGVGRKAPGELAGYKAALVAANAFGGFFPLLITAAGTAKLLHTPLMSASNAIHGIVFVGVMITGAEAQNTAGYILTFVGAVFAAMNVVGGYSVTDRMLKMFHRRAVLPVAPGSAKHGN